MRKPEVSTALHENESQVQEAFGRQSVIFDEIYSQNLTIQYKRQRVREHVNRYLQPGSRILELNAGTGEDAVWFANQGHHVHATDLTEGMLTQLKQKVRARGLDAMITTEQCSFNELHRLEGQGPYDLIFSNFAGLNCTDKLDEVIQSFYPLLAPRGAATMVIMPPFCLWETALALQGNFKAAFRRLNSKNGRKAHIEGQYFTCWYYKPSYIRQAAAQSHFEVLDIEALCTIVPPSYFENFGRKRPRLFSSLKRWESRLCRTWPWLNIGDYYIVTLRKKG